MINNSPLVFNASGTLIEESVVSIDEQAGAYGSCPTMLNGEAIIFGGYFNSNITRQVHLKINFHKLEILSFSDFGGF